MVDIVMTKVSPSETVGSVLKKGDIVVFESTVYPGATEEDCVPVLEAESGLKCGVDFKVGYSPERINPGDKERTFTKILKIVSGMDEETLEIVADVYASVVKAGVHKAPTIKVAEETMMKPSTRRCNRLEPGRSHRCPAEALCRTGQSYGTRQGRKWNGRANQYVTVEQFFPIIFT